MFVLLRCSSHLPREQTLEKWSRQELHVRAGILLPFCLNFLLLVSILSSVLKENSE